MHKNYLPILAIVALATTVSSRVWAAGIEISPEGDSFFSASNLSGGQVSAAMVTGLQEFLGTGTGQDLISQEHSLSIIQELSANSAFHRSLIAKLGFPTGFAGQSLLSQLITAVKSADKTALENVGAAVSKAYRAENARHVIMHAVNERADGIAAAIHHGDITDAKEISDDASDLAPFVSVSLKARSAMTLVRVASISISDAQRLAHALMDNRAVVDASGKHYLIPTSGQHGVMVYNDSGYQGMIDAHTIEIGTGGEIHALSRHGDGHKAEVYHSSGHYLRMELRKNSGSARGTMDINTMNQLTLGHEILNKGRNYGKQDSFYVNVLRTYKGRKFSATGVLNTMYQGAHDIRKTLYVYLEDARGQTVSLFSKDFFSLKNADRYIKESLHAGAPVVVDFTVKSGPFWRESPFQIEKIMPLDEAGAPLSASAITHARVESFLQSLQQNKELSNSQINKRIWKFYKKNSTALDQSDVEALTNGLREDKDWGYVERPMLIGDYEVDHAAALAQRITTHWVKTTASARRKD